MDGIRASWRCRSWKGAALRADLDSVRLLLAGPHREPELGVALHDRMGQGQTANSRAHLAVDGEEAQGDRLGSVVV